MARDFAAEVKSAAAKQSFVSAAWRTLSPKDIHHLMSIPPTESTQVQTWAAHWRVNAPCMFR